MRRFLVLSVLLLTFAACKTTTTMKNNTKPFVWEAANMYFLLTDRFNNGTPQNDVNFNRTQEAAKFRGFMGGDLKGITKKIKEGYFTDLGINAIWMSPIVEQIHAPQDEGTGATYGFHGYWTKDWTRIDPNFGNEEDLRELVQSAREKGIKILLDAVINHTGPATEQDPVWPDSWVRTSPTCTFEDYDTTVNCTLVENLPDIRTESNEDVELPPQLVEKWKAEGRYEKEVAELDAFFTETGYPRAPRFYIMKWLTDYIREFGFEGYRVDTVKHVEESVWQEFKVECDRAYAQYKSNHPEEQVHPYFYLVGEVYNYGVSGGQWFDFGDRKVNYFDASFHSLINFEFKSDAEKLTYDKLFSKYDRLLNAELKDFGTLNYLTSHDDGAPYDRKREKTKEAATRLLLSPGTSQIYYGDESARSLVHEGTQGDADLRSPMNWDEFEQENTQSVLKHYQKLGRFRSSHPSIGAGRHSQLQAEPYVFKRTWEQNDVKDEVVVGLNLPLGLKDVPISEQWTNGTLVRDVYSGTESIVKNGKIQFTTDFDILLLERI